jgi:oxygen-dependent protoporphyrinogen oxidase
MKVTVIGAGFSGLATAYYLRKRGLEVEVVDKSKRVGGLISTLECDYGLIETAANGLVNSELVEEMFGDLGLLLTPPRPRARKRYIFRQRPQRWPLGIFETLAMLTRLCWRFLFGFKNGLRPREGETMRQWTERNLGPAALRYLVGPGLQGIYAGDVNRLSAGLILGKFFAPSRASRKLSLRGTVAPRKGMGQLIGALRDWLKTNGVAVRLDTEVVWNPEIKNWRWVIATGASDAAKILSSHPAARVLEMIEVSPVVSVTAFFHPLDAGVKGFGVLFPRGEGVRALGVLVNNEIFEGRSNDRSETWIYGGALDHEVCDFSDPEILSQLMRDRKIVERGISKPLHYRIQRWPAAIPHYTVNLERLLVSLPEIKNTFLVGNYLGGLGLGKILERSFAVAETVAAQTSETPILERPAVETRGPVHQSRNS